MAKQLRALYYLSGPEKGLPFLARNSQLSNYCLLFANNIGIHLLARNVWLWNLRYLFCVVAVMITLGSMFWLGFHITLPLFINYLPGPGRKFYHFPR